MTVLATRRSVMTLYCEALDPIGHAVRIVLAEKDINVEVNFVDHATKPEDLNDLNPYGQVLTLLDRELVLYEAQIMMEYLDERFPHPPLMPVDPVARANNRQIRYRMVRDLYRLIDDLMGTNEIAGATARKTLRDNLTAIAPSFAQFKCFFSDDYSLADCCLVPLLWRVEHFGVKLPPQAKPLRTYAETMFSRPTFKSSLSGDERRLRRL